MSIKLTEWTFTSLEIIFCEHLDKEVRWLHLFEINHEFCSIMKNQDILGTTFNDHNFKLPQDYVDTNLYI